MSGTVNIFYDIGKALELEFHEYESDELQDTLVELAEAIEHKETYVFYSPDDRFQAIINGAHVVEVTVDYDEDINA